MKKKKISLAVAVREIAASWKEEYVESGSGASLSRLVQNILEENVTAIVLSVLGIKKDYGNRVELLKSPDGKASIIEIIRDRQQEALIHKIQQSPFFNDLTNFRVGPKEMEYLKNEFKDTFMDKLHEKVREKATEFAEQIAASELRDIWVDEDVVRFVEDKLKEDDG